MERTPGLSSKLERLSAVYSGLFETRLGFFLGLPLDEAELLAEPLAAVELLREYRCFFDLDIRGFWGCSTLLSSDSLSSD